MKTTDGWLVKTEPETYSFDDLCRDGKTSWDGVRNYTARNFLRLMKRGDLAFVYHSGGDKQIVGICQVEKEAYPDPTVEPGSAEAAKGWVAVEVRPLERLARPLPLAELKAEATLRQMEFIRQSRLSVSPVSAAQWQAVVALARR